jgi:1-acylglycerone phosphate reductase
LGNLLFLGKGYYNASKAAVNLLSDQLLIGLSTFNVKVVNVVTRSVLTRFMESLARSRRLPPNSLYSPAKQAAEDVKIGEIAFKNAMNVETYAEEVAKNVIKSSPKEIQWLGGDVFLILACRCLFWATIWASPSLVLLER